MDDESLSQPTSTSASTSASSTRVVGKRTRTRNCSETLWPKRVKVAEANTIFSVEEGVWDTIEAVNICGETYQYIQHQECDHDLLLSNGTFKIKSKDYDVNLACRPVQRELFLKAKFLYEQVIALPDMDRDTDHEITSYARAARQAEPESDGEDIHDPAIVPAFDEVELVVVKIFFKKLFNAYERAMAIGLYNCVGKEFLDAAGEYVDLCTRVDVTPRTSSQFLYLHNTSTGGPQPGAAYINWSVPKREKSGGSTRNIMVRERYAGSVTYDKINIVNVIVGEVKESEDSAIESQNNEQMLRLWKGSQQAMLGLEARGRYVRPKVLSLYKGKLNMCYLKELDLAQPNDLLSLVKLMIAFVVCVEYCLVTETD